MNKIKNISILGSFFGLWIATLFSQESQIIVAFALIFSFGILHGANDLVLIKKVQQNNKTLSFVKILIGYIVIVGLGFVLFNFMPLFALVLFIIVSAYHFGEQHWQIIGSEIPKWKKLLLQFIYGLFVLSMVFYFHQSEVQQIIFGITQFNLPAYLLTTLFVFSGILLMLNVCYFSIISLRFRTRIIKEAFYLLVFAIVFYTSNLIWGFALYFVLWHSIPSLADQIRFLYGSFNWENFIAYFKSAFLYWVISLIGIALLYYFLKETKIFNALFFSSLAAITFPHVVVILKMTKSIKKS